MSDFISGNKKLFIEVIEHLKKEMNSLRVGRATPALVENVMVEAYGAFTPVIHLASVNIVDPKTIGIQPWDKGLVKDIEKALQKANLGMNPVVKESQILLTMPSMTEETRKEVIKKLNQKLEEARVSIRNQREKIKEKVLADEKDKQISEDDKFRRLDELDKEVKDFNDQIRDLGKKKEEEIMTI